jgi:CO/xanthine dehydrogenase Mo-binding subunit
MAKKAAMDPLEFRLNNLQDKRMRKVLIAVAEKFDWVNRKKQSGTGFGIACGIDAGTYVSTMTEVKVDKNSGHVQVERVVCAQDMGLVINPQGGGEPAIITMGGVIANAIYDAIDVRMFQLPMTPDRIRKALGKG